MRRRPMWGKFLAFLMAAVLAAGGAQPLLGQQRPVGRQAPGQRALLERRLQQRVEEIERRELRLTPEQAQRLRATKRRFEANRLTVLQRERQLRRALRAELAAGEGANGQRVDGYLTELLQLQRQRLDILEEEQRALSEFLTPVQRARYLALQENLRNRLEQAARGSRQGGGARRPPAGGGGRPH
ncbi:MAG TPA: hypothetical protein VFS08_20385 [Gemmatimonadaceae bacterium]|nr:hypothetical protein [Gemmatimonadaceae bacterium]